ncbi:hypothetical protein PHLGIDRAFT_76947, partial [Phlebiopsis gigantea 11061_1 CR5-6]
YFQLTRLHKFPAGSNLVFWPGAWGVTLSACRVGMPAKQVFIQIGMYLLGSTLRHSAACVWNDICDREFDRQVVGFLILDPLYPLMKRWTHWPQAFLGLAMTWALPTAWVSINGFHVVSIPLVLLVGGTSWTIYYDTIYACQDRRDDIKAGIKSTAVLFGEYIRPIVFTFAVGFIASLTYGGVATGAGAPYFIITVIITSVELVWQMVALDFDNGVQCWTIFKINGNLVGATVWIGTFVDYLVRVRSCPSWAL